MIPAQLTQACHDVRPATAADDVGGVLPDFVAAPASTEEASALLRAAAELGLAVVPRGGGTRLDWGVPPRRCDLIVDTRQLDQVLEHAAGDLVARVQAGLRLDRLTEVLSAAGQRLAVDPPNIAPSTAPNAAPSPANSHDTGTANGHDPGTSNGHDPGTSNGHDPGTSNGHDSGTSGATSITGASASAEASRASSGTVGGLVATGVAGPLRLRFGGPRDLLIGITFVRADGTIARAGGKVVKNVAGYDIGKLLAGSYGTLGLITEATFRLHPCPPAAAYVCVSSPPASAGTAAAALLTAAGSPLAPVAAELDWPGRDAPVTVALALEGDAEGVAERADLMRDLLSGATAADGSGGGEEAVSGPEVSSSPPPWWGRGPAAASQGTVLRIAFWAGQLTSVLVAIRATAADAGLDPAVGGSAAAGVLHAALPAGVPPEAVARFVTALRAALNNGHAGAAGPRTRSSVVVLHAPPPVREAVDLWGPASAVELMRAVKDQFDPEHRMSPGRFVGGI